MSQVLNYKGYQSVVRFDSEDRILFGRIEGINDMISFHADDGDGVISAFHEAVDDYLDTCAKIGKSPDRAYSGKVMVRVDPAVHARAALAARLSGISLNQFSEQALAELAERRLSAG